MLGFLLGLSLSLCGPHCLGLSLQPCGLPGLLEVDGDDLPPQAVSSAPEVFPGRSLADSRGNNILGNNISNNNLGIGLGGSSDNNIIGNKVGTYLDKSSNNTFSLNNIANNSDYGIHLSDSSNCNFLENDVISDRIGAFLERSSNNTLSNGKITDYSLYGVHLFESSDYNVIKENKISRSQHGIFLLGSSIYNSIFQNNVTSNGIGAYLDHVRRYVESGGGMAMIGGALSFSSGAYGEWSEATKSIRSRAPSGVAARDDRRTPLLDPSKAGFTMTGKERPSKDASAAPRKARNRGVANPPAATRRFATGLSRVTQSVRGSDPT